MSSWIIRVDPDKQGFKLAESLGDVHKSDGSIALMPIQHERDLKRDDHVYLWQLGARPGLCGTAYVTGECEERPQPAWQQAFGDAKNYRPEDRRILLKLKRFTTEPVSRDSDGSVIWKPNSGTTQKCPSPKCPPDTVKKFDAIAEAFAPSLEEYRRLLREVRRSADTDRIVQVLARAEQAYWRKVLFGSPEGSCALCGRNMPVDLLVAAHIKQRSHCSDQERSDRENVMAACLLGCDAFFEKGYIRVDDGRVRINKGDRRSMLDALAVLEDKPISLTPPGWTANRAKYFNARQESIRGNDC